MPTLSQKRERYEDWFYGEVYVSPKIKICKEEDCNDQATTKGFCRFHYLKNWTETRQRRKKAVQKLNRYVEKVIRSHPDDYLSEISKDLHRWDEGDVEELRSKLSMLDDSQTSDENVEDLINNLRLDDDY